jgi:hypothetical protein
MTQCLADHACVSSERERLPLEPPASHQDEAQAMLRDIAFVLHLTRRVKYSVTQERRGER